jgi:hypothetical protein
MREDEDMTPRTIMGHREFAVGQLKMRQSGESLMASPRRKRRDAMASWTQRKKSSGSQLGAT